MMTLKDLTEVADVPTTGGGGEDLEIIASQHLQLSNTSMRWEIGAVAVEKHGDREYLVVDLGPRRRDLEGG